MTSGTRPLPGIRASVVTLKWNRDVRRRRVLAVLIAVIGAGALVAVAPTQVSGAGETFDLVGTWTGDYRYSLGTDKVVVRTDDQFISFDVVLRRQ